MRLLSREDGRLRLIEFADDKVPAYAILSHTWGAAGEEIIFKDLTDGAIEVPAEGSDKSKGFSKLQFCADQAVRDGLEYFWVDTCCIDRSDTIEVQHAVNSMFRWYGNAVKCYVYLSDVDSSDHQDSWRSEFLASRWFTRGWTLQELLAPKSVEFFSKRGDRLGDKASLEAQILEITKVPAKALRGAPVSQFTVEERMSWIKDRQTKYAEDKAYALQGLFEVYMPVIYGEGEKNAFRRLRQEIQHSSLPQIGPPSPSSTVPFRRDQSFLDRDILAKIRQKCSLPAARVALVGLGGVGKSQLAIEWSYRVRDESAETWVFWVHAGSVARFEEGYRTIANRAKIPDWENPEANILQLVSNWLCDETNGRWVMIVDNADDPSVFFKQAEGEELDSATRSLADFLPQSPNGSLLITSRNRDVAFRLTGDASDIINVEPLDKKQSVDLLCKKLSSAPDREDAIELVEALDGMPLAITQAAAFISRGEPRMTVSKYLQDLRASDENRAQLLKKDIGDARRDGKASNSIMSTWEISFKYIRNNWPSAAQLLSLMSLFDRQGIPEILLRDKYSHDNETELNLDDDISILASYSLITINHDGNDFEMHRLVQFATKKWLELNEELELWKEKYIEILYEDFPAGEYENWKICQKLFPHAQMVLLYRPANDECLRKWAGILHEAGRYADTRGNYNMAEEMIRQSLEGLQQVLGGEPQPTLAAMANLATTYEHQGRWKEAQGIQEQVLEMFIRVLGKEHPTTLLSMANLGLIYNRQHRWREAEEMLVSGLEMCSRVLGQEHETTRVCMNNLALTYRDQGRWKEAEELFTQVRDTATRTLGTEHPLSLIYMSNLALVYWDQGRRKEAEELQAQVAEMRARVLGEQHPNTLRAVKYLEVYRSTYQLDEALNADAQETEKSSVLGEKRRNGPTRVAKLMYRKFKDTLRGHK